MNSSFRTVIEKLIKHFKPKLNCPSGYVPEWEAFGLEIMQVYVEGDTKNRREFVLISLQEVSPEEHAWPRKFGNSTCLDPIWERTWECWRSSSSYHKNRACILRSQHTWYRTFTSASCPSGRCKVLCIVADTSIFTQNNYKSSKLHLLFMYSRDGQTLICSRSQNYEIMLSPTYIWSIEHTLWFR